MSSYLRRFQSILCALLICSVNPGLAQEHQPPALLSRSGEDMVVTAQGPRPLSLALNVVTEQFGWAVDYEDPIYSPTETRDAAVPEWRNQHPGEQGLLIPSGGKFVADLGKVNTQSPNEQQTLDGLIKQYNHTPNPGFFRLIRSTAHRWIVSGWSRTENTPSGILDTMMQPGPDRQSALDALKSLTAQCGAHRGKSIELGIIPNNVLSQRWVDGFNGKLSCRDQLARIMAAASPSMVYDLFYDIGSKGYFLSIVPAHRVVIGPNGTSTTVPLEKYPSK